MCDPDTKTISPFQELSIAKAEEIAVRSHGTATVVFRVGAALALALPLDARALRRVALTVPAEQVFVMPRD